MSRRLWVSLGVALTAAALFAHWAERPHPRAPTVVAEQPAPAPYRKRTEYRPAESARPARAAWAARPETDHRSAEVVDGVLQLGPIRRGPRPQPPAPAPAQAAASWANDYSIAVCDCQTRACVAALQGRFIGAMGGVDYDEQRDATAYREAVNRALECYFRLPEDT